MQISLAGIFPEAKHDPVIQIANMVIRQGESEPFLRNIFTFGTCAPIVGCQVLSFEKENIMLEVCRLKYTVKVYECQLFFSNIDLFFFSLDRNGLILYGN